MPHTIKQNTPMTYTQLTMTGGLIAQVTTTANNTRIVKVFREWDLTKVYESQFLAIDEQVELEDMELSVSEDIIETREVTEY